MSQSLITRNKPTERANKLKHAGYGGEVQIPGGPGL